jgi:hypothetical protein
VRRSQRAATWEEGSKVLLTNSLSTKKRGPKETHAGNIYAFAHQAYWGFRFLAEHKKSLWQQVLNATTTEHICKIGRVCSLPGGMARAGYAAAGMMERLENESVAKQIIAAKNHRRYPRSGRPSSQDRRMIFLAIAVAAAVWDIKFSTALRKLAQAGLGAEYMEKEVHRSDRLQEMLKKKAYVWAESVGNYFFPSAHGKWELMHDLPCAVPADWQGGYIIHGFGPSGSFQSTFSRTLPTDLEESLSAQDTHLDANEITIGTPPRKTLAPNHVMCRCGATIAASSKKLALKALAEHMREVHGKGRRSRSVRPGTK